MEGVPVRYVDKPATAVPAYMDAGVAALKKALLKARVNIYDPTTVSLLSCLQNVHDAFGVWEWRERLASIARQFGLSAARLEKHAA
jgi:NADH:ubiquinone oxidoreductase subunit E